MLPKNRRIGKKLFPAILSRGRNYHTDSLAVRLLAQPGGGATLFAIVVPVKTAKTAVERHFLMRRGRHAIRKHLSEITGGFYCAIFLRAEMKTLPFHQFEAKILNGLKAAGLIKSSVNNGK
jgi:ribonuclease P protein component